MNGVRASACALLSLSLWISAAYAAPITYTNRATFEAALGTRVTDDYSNSGYVTGDVSDGSNTDVFTNAGMSAILGETDYLSTSHANFNAVTNQALDPQYCAGCN